MPDTSGVATTRGVPSWLILTLGCTVLFVSGGSRFAFGLMLKPMTEELGWGRALVSLVSTIFMAVSACGQPLAGRLMDRYQPLWIIGLGLLCGGLGIALMGAVTSVWHAVLAYGVIFALGQAASSVSTVGVMVSRAFGSRRGIATSAAMAGSALGQLVILTLLASVLTTLGWRVAYVGLGMANLLVIVVLALFLRKTSLSRRTATSKPGAAHLTPGLAGTAGARPGHMALLAMLYTVCGIQDFFVSTHVVAFATDHGVGPVVAGNVFAFMGLMGLLGVLGAGVLADAYGPVLPTLLCFLARVGLFAYIPFVQDEVSIILFALLYGATFLVTAPLTVIFAERAVGASRMGSVSGLLSMIHQIAGGVGALFGGSVFDRWGSYNYAFFGMLGLSVLATCATWLLRDNPIARPSDVSAPANQAG